MRKHLLQLINQHEADQGLILDKKNAHVFGPRRSTDTLRKSSTSTRAENSGRLQIVKQTPLSCTTP